MKFDLLVENISSIHEVLQSQASHAVNLALTARNWLVGCYIVEYEQKGEDRSANPATRFGGCHPPNRFRKNGCFLQICCSKGFHTPI